MSNLNTDIVNFLQWFSQCEAIPVQTRQQILGAIIEAKGITPDLGLKISAIVKLLRTRIEAENAFLADQVQWLETNLQRETNPATSTKESFVQAGLAEMEATAEKFKTDVNTYNQNVRVKAETAEHAAELDQVAALKAAL